MKIWTVMFCVRVGQSDRLFCWWRNFRCCSNGNSWMNICWLLKILLYHLVSYIMPNQSHLTMTWHWIYGQHYSLRETSSLSWDGSVIVFCITSLLLWLILLICYLLKNKILWSLLKFSDILVLFQMWINLKFCLYCRNR